MQTTTTAHKQKQTNTKTKLPNASNNQKHNLQSKLQQVKKHPKVKENNNQLIKQEHQP